MIKLDKKIFPPPKRLEQYAGVIELPSSIPFNIQSPEFDPLLPFLSELGYTQNSKPEECILFFRKESTLSQEDYRLEISPSEIIISSNQPIGSFHGLQTLLQITRLPECKSFLPCTKIQDSPSLRRRGFMLDVSRCKVPTMKSVFSLIDLLAALHINEFQLYIEHTFAFKEHETVWKNASPFTASEIQAIDQYCRDRFIELVPNLNSFGHFERWLMHSDYKDLAECPDGFRRENPFIERDHGTTLKPNQKSLDFINSLYHEYLPNFSSKKFNVGMDEPWELGQGWCKEKVQAIGKDKVYLKHLDGIRKLVESHGKEMQFWADVLLEKPENAKLLCPTASPIIWGYEPNHPFSEQAKAISSCGLKYCLAPGTGAWRSFTGRWPGAMENIDSAINNAMEHNAEGILLTSWGDCGNHQPWATLYPALFYGAIKSWNHNSLSEKELIRSMDQHLFNGTSRSPSSCLIEVGKLDKVINSKIPNTSLCWFALFAPLPDKLINFLKKNHQVNQLTNGIEFLQSVHQSLDFSSQCVHTSLVSKEISNGIELSTLALKKGIKLLGGKEWKKLSLDHPLFANYQKNWLSRARPGGLEESLNILIESTTQNL
jgi:hypothetical protein